MGHFWFCLGLRFFEFHLTHLNMKQPNFWSGVQGKRAAPSYVTIPNIYGRSGVESKILQNNPLSEFCFDFDVEIHVNDSK